ncbi:hypothetical protein AK95_03265 [Paenibacillus sp. LC231]|uniref:Rad50/SbcC-type AAA domain-containing protein n=1 Tax=Paenibacillus glucanolyticus TaxID=59843 RepID=A0A163GEM0_9BACL|nr:MULTISPECIES: AAA family ATPase [Paenibacillus]KZS44931.1 hypothetical protein AWU65_02800 [Paenibacillus glucanolyticus]OIB01935.1 hypothetical protein AK95_03265 [Paenibacillus sp. LC231]OMF65521.1 hypothetical protein BK142_30710 [Paenibacillus glucanolyticus]
MKRIMDKKYLPIRFLNLEMEGFSYFPRQEIPLDAQIIGLIGNNGAGKTTILNMIRVLIGSRKFDNNQSLQTFFERDDVDEIYIVGRFVNTIHPTYGKRPFEAIGKRQDTVSIVCRIKRDPCKREYCVFDGYFDLDLDLKAYIRWLNMEQYARQMQEIGLTRSLINACSLDQGKTEDIMDLNEEKLADYILQICGEQERLDRFNQIKADIKTLKEQYFHINLQKQQQELTLREIENNISLCKRILELEHEIKALQLELPLSEYAHLMNVYEEFNQEIVDLLQKEHELISKIETNAQLLADHTQQLSKTKINIIELNGSMRELSEKRTSTAVEISNHERNAAELSTFIETYHPLPVQDIAQLSEGKHQLNQSYKDQLTITTNLKNQLHQLEHKIARMETSKKSEFPAGVIQLKKWLESKAIDHLLIADCIDIPDPSWQEAIEAMLGTERFTIVVSPEDMVQVMKEAQAIKYPFWVSPYKPAYLQLKKQAVLNKILLKDERIAGYLQRFENVMIAHNLEEAWAWVRKGNSALLNSPSPYYVVERGGRSIGAKGLYCGQSAFQAQLKADKKHALEQKSLLIQSEEQEVLLLEQLNAIIEEIKTQEQILLLPSKKDTLAHTYMILQQLQHEMDTLTKSRDECTNSLLELVTLQNQLSNQAGVLTEKLNGYRGELSIVEVSIRDKKSQKINIEAQADEIRSQFTEEQRVALAVADKLATLEKPEQYRKSIEMKESAVEILRNNISGGAVRPGEEIATVKLEQSYEKHRMLLDQHQEEIQKIQDDLDKLEKKRVEAKNEYRIMVDEVFQKVRKSLEEMAARGNFEASLRAVYLEDERWKVDYRLGFNGKPAKSYRDKSALSGGQKVIASLLLTFAAIKADGVLSFMLLDEPFAHLDEERIALAGQFLSNSEAQIIIGMPYSENIKLMMPWMNMLLNFRPKKRNETVAPPITYGKIRP